MYWKKTRFPTRSINVNANYELQDNYHELKYFTFRYHSLTLYRLEFIVVVWQWVGKEPSKYFLMITSLDLTLTFQFSYISLNNKTQRQSL